MATSNRGQAAHGIEEILKLIQKKSIKNTLLPKFEKYLNKHHKLKELNEEQLSKTARLFRIQKNLKDLSPETFAIVFRWIEDYSEQLSISMRELQEIDNTLLEFALINVFEHQRHDSFRDKKFDQLLATRYLRIADKGRTGVYASLEVLLGESGEEIKTKCIKYLRDNPFPLEQKQVKSILRKNKTIHSHISDLESSDEGDPFIFYAASIVYQHHIHVLCAADEGLEEYVFYPSELPSERESCDHKFIGHLSENNYFSLESTEQKFQKRYESEKLVREYQAKIKKLEEDIKDNKEKYLILSQKMKKSKEENLKLSIEIEKVKEKNLKLSIEMKKSKEENLKLSKEMGKSKKENLILSKEMGKSKEKNLKLSAEMEKIKEENLKLSKEKERYKQHVEDLQTELQDMKSDIQLVNDKLDTVLSVLIKKSSLSNMSDSTNSKKAIDDEKDKEEKQTNENKSAQVANNAQNNEDRDEPNNDTTGKGKEVRLLSAKKTKHSGKGEHRDKPKDVRHDTCTSPQHCKLPPVNITIRERWSSQF